MTTVSGRQKLGVALIVIALAGAVVLQITTGNLFHITSTEKTPPVGGPAISFQMEVTTIKLTWGYAGPIIACAALGFCCLLIPRRRVKSSPPPFP